MSIRSLYNRLRRLLFSTASSPTAPLELQKKIGYTFKNQQILLQALKHRSYLVNSGEERRASNERLELLGDAVLGFLVTEYLYHHFPSESEGVLTNYKSLLVSGPLLGEFANELKLGSYLLLHDAESRAGGRQRLSILADAMESLIGAVYLDGGVEAARQFVARHISHRMDSLLNDERLRNSKSLLQEFCQRFNHQGPIYSVEEASGPDHQRFSPLQLP